MGAQITAAGGTLIKFPAATKNPLRILTNARAIAQFIRTQGVDLVHARSRAPAWSSFIATRLARVPFVTTYHGAYGNTGTLKNAYNSVMARGDRVIANSQYTYKLIKRRHQTPKNKLTVIYRGVDTAYFDPEIVTPKQVSKLLKDWGVAPKQRIVIHAARLTSWKGQVHSIDAVDQLFGDSEFDDVVLIFAGDPQGRTAFPARLTSKIEQLGLSGRVKMVGHCDDMAAAYKAADAAIIASVEPEAFGRASAEASAMGLPVIATSIGAPAEHLIVTCDKDMEDATGWLVPPGDGAALARALRHVLTLSEEDRHRLATRARSHIATNFSSDRMRLSTLGVYDELLNTALAEAYAQNRPHSP